MNGLILRTCEKVSPKCWFTDSDLIIKKNFLLNTLEYALNNNYKIFIVCDSLSLSYKNLVKEIFENYATIYFHENLGPYGSFEKQLQIALDNDLEFIEIAEDDFLKRGLIDFKSLNKSTTYTGYHHPNYNKLPWSALENITGNLYSTVCSFILHKSVLEYNINSFYRFRISSDSEMWYEMTTPVWLKILIKIKSFSQFRNSKISLIKNGSLKLRRLETNVVWVHCAQDSLPLVYSDFSNYANIDVAINYFNL